MSQASVTLSGQALVDAGTIRAGQEAVVLVDLDGSTFSYAALATLNADLTISDSSSYSGFSVVDTGSVVDLFSASVLSVSATIDLIDGIDTGDSFAIIVFDASTGTTTANDTYSIFTDPSWVLPVDAFSSTFGSDLAQITGAPVATGTVIPEPSTYAALAGFLALGWVALGRRK